MAFIRFYPMALSHGVQHVRFTTAAMKVNNFFLLQWLFLRKLLLIFRNKRFDEEENLQ